ncbi:MAG: HD domain-containing protein, partial [Candidatus Heimdallarchaeota archaeon]|nr:HD domain-containing protein [Candidatus Heimdallarchaeota archaeon]
MTSLEFEPFFEDINENKSNHKRNKEKIKVAFELAKEKHKYQKRRMSDDPYFVHPLRTAKLLRDFDDDLIIAGLLHDIVEDTQTSGEEVKAMF